LSFVDDQLLRETESRRCSRRENDCSDSRRRARAGQMLLVATSAGGDA
jgi:hypothetical protein